MLELQDAAFAGTLIVLFILVTVWRLSLTRKVHKNIHQTPRHPHVHKQVHMLRHINIIYLCLLIIFIVAMITWVVR
jgi:hypothetical protein